MNRCSVCAEWTSTEHLWGDLLLCDDCDALMLDSYERFCAEEDGKLEEGDNADTPK